MSKTYRIAVMDYEAMDPTSGADRIRNIMSFAPGRCGSNFANVLSTSFWIGYVWVPQDPTNDKSIFVSVMAWCRQAHHMKRSFNTNTPFELFAIP